MTILRRLSILLLLLSAESAMVVALSAPGWAFDPSYHADITVKGLRTSGLGFSEIAISNISNHTYIVDTSTVAGQVKDTDPWHFDNHSENFDDKSLEIGSALIYQERLAIVAMLIGKEAASELALLKAAGGARQLLGFALHSLQDFYSHSNWIELGLGRTKLGHEVNPFKDINKNRTDPPCEKGNGSKVSSQNARVSTAYYNFFHSENRANADKGRCIHGPSTVPAPIPGDPPIDSIDGISKDAPSKPPRENDLFEIAKGRAVLATAAFAHLIISDLKDANAYRAICAFLGKPTGPCSRAIRIYSIGAVIGTPQPIAFNHSHQFSDSQGDSRNTSSTDNQLGHIALFVDGDTAMSLYSPTVCQEGDHWTAKPYSWEVAWSIPAVDLGTGNSGEGYRAIHSGGFTVSADGQITVTYNNSTSSDLTNTQEGVLIDKNRMQSGEAITYTINLVTGAGSYSRTYGSSENFERHYEVRTDPFPQHYSSSQSFQTVGSGSWGEEEVRPPETPNLHASFMTVFIGKDDPLPEGCI